MLQKKICLGIGAAGSLAFGAALLLLLEPATGFVRGWVWLPYLLAGGGMAVILLTSLAAGNRPKALLAYRAPLGVPMLLTGGALLAAGGNSLLKAFDLANGTGLDVIFGVLLALAALWFFVQGGAAFAPVDGTALPGAGWALAVIPAFGWVLVKRFMLAPASLYRVGTVLPALSAMAALLFLTALVKVFYLPGAPFGKSLYRCGLAAFLLCTCGELPCTVLGFAGGSAGLTQLLLSIAYALLGGCGLVCAGYTCGEELPPEPEPAKTEKGGKTIRAEK